MRPHFNMNSTLNGLWQFLLKSSEGGVWGVFFGADIEAKIDENTSGNIFPLRLKLTE